MSKSSTSKFFSFLHDETPYLIEVDDIAYILGMKRPERADYIAHLRRYPLTSLGKRILDYIKPEGWYEYPDPQHARHIMRVVRAEHLFFRLYRAFMEERTPVPALRSNYSPVRATIALGAVTEQELWEALRVAHALQRADKSAFSPYQHFDPQTCGIIARVLRRTSAKGMKGDTILNSKWEAAYLQLIRLHGRAFARANDLRAKVKLVREIIDETPIWRVKGVVQMMRAAPTMPLLLAKRYARLTREARLIIAGLWNTEFHDVPMNAEGRLLFEAAVARAINGDAAHRGAAYRRYAPHVMSHGRGVDIVLRSGADTPELRKAGLTGVTARGFKLGAWRKAKAMPEVAALLAEDGAAYFWVANAVLIFGNETPEFIRRQLAAGRNAHDSLYWLAAAKPAEGLSALLFANLQRPTSELGIVATNYANLAPAERAGKWADVLVAIRANTYAGARHKAWAAECAKWGVAQSQYHEFEKLYLNSFLVPEFVPQLMGRVWEKGGIRGYFLPRADVRGAWLGQYTSCCQHPLGAGATCAKHGLCDPDGGFFVVTTRDDEIIAQSWCHRHWQGEGKAPRIVFDNVEKREGAKVADEIIRAIYAQAALALAELGYEVSTGTNTDVEIGTSLRAPALYPLDCYTDARTQVFVLDTPPPVVEPPVAPPTIKNAPIAICHDLAKQIYPEGWQFVSTPDEGEFEKWGFAEGQKFFGYIVIGQEDEANYIFDLAILPAYRHHAPPIFGRMLTYMAVKYGRVWSADCRASTSYQTLLKGAAKGYYRILGDVESDQTMDGEPMRLVTFEILEVHDGTTL